MLKTIWNCQFVTKNQGSWTCGWCGITFNPDHSKRAVCHLLKIPGNKIRACSATISPENHAAYQVLYDATVKWSEKRTGIKEGKERIMQERQDATVAAVMDQMEMRTIVKENGKKSKDSAVAKPPNHQSNMSTFVTATKRTKVARSSPAQAVRHEENQPSLSAMQDRKTQQDIRACNNTKLSVAIADMIHSDGLPFSFAGSSRLAKVIRLSKLVDKDFKPPSRNVVAGSLLELSYKANWEENKEILLAEAEMFGISLLGDGATIGKMPLMNVLAMSGDNPPIVAGIHDCTDHMAAGGKKDARYIADMFEEWVEELDPGKNNGVVDSFFFDGASNVQKAGEVLSITNPGAVCLHGAEHVISLFFSDIAKCPQIKVCLYHV